MSLTSLKKRDNSELYEKIGDIVIERAHAGDDVCLNIYERAARTIQEIKERKASFSGDQANQASHKNMTSGDVYNVYRRLSD